MGTTSFCGQFGSMRETEDFTVYPINKYSNLSQLEIQSDKRYGIIFIAKKKLVLSRSYSNYPNPEKLRFDIDNKKAAIIELQEEELNKLLQFVRSTASAMACGHNGCIYTDNSYADKV